MEAHDQIIREHEGTMIPSRRPIKRTVSHKHRVLKRDFVASAIEACGETYHREFIDALTILLQEKKNWDIVKYCYSPFSTPDGISGALLWDNATKHGFSSKYYIPQAESSLIERHEALLEHVFSDIKPFGLMLGPGSTWAQICKEEPVLRAINARGAASVDLNHEFAEGAAIHISRALGIPTQKIICDFTKPLPNNIKYPETSPIMATMFGSTITQFSLHDDNTDNATSLCGFLNNLRDMTHNRGFLFVTIDSNLHPERAKDCYNGRHFRALQNWFWDFTKYMTGDEHFCPRALDYHPQVGPETHAVIHSHAVFKETALEVDGTRYIFSGPSQYEIGSSQKWTSDEFKRVAAKCDWEELCVCKDDGTVRGLLYMDKKMPTEYASPVKQALNNAPAYMFG